MKYIMEINNKVAKNNVTIAVTLKCNGKPKRLKINGIGSNQNIATRYIGSYYPSGCINTSKQLYITVVGIAEIASYYVYFETDDCTPIQQILSVTQTDMDVIIYNENMVEMYRKEV